MRRYIFPVLLGVIGVAILISLGVWQLQRLQWKEAMLAEIQAKIDAPPVALPASPAPSMKYLPVEIRGRTTGREILALSGSEDEGAGYQVISAFETDTGRKIMVDRGFIREGERKTARPPVDLIFRGNLHWPQEITSATPRPNLDENIWFAREVPAMAAQLGTEPVLVVASAVGGDSQGVEPIPISITGIPNNHLEYAWTWFLLALVWGGMTVYLITRIRSRSY